MENIATGMTAQAWGVLLGLMACVIGPMFVGERFSIPAFSLVVVVLMSIAGLWRVHGANADEARLRENLIPALLIPARSAALMVSCMLVHFDLHHQASLAVLAALLGSGTCWFLGECCWLRLLENLAHSLPGRDTVHRIRHVRWGSYVVTLLISLGVAQSMWDGRRFGMALPQVSGSFIVMTSVSLTVLSLLSTLLCGHVSRLAKEQAAYVLAFTAPDLIQIRFQDEALA